MEYRAKYYFWPIIKLTPFNRAFVLFFERRLADSGSVRELLDVCKRVRRGELDEEEFLSDDVFSCVVKADVVYIEERYAEPEDVELPLDNFMEILAGWEKFVLSCGL